MKWEFEELKALKEKNLFRHLVLAEASNGPTLFIEKKRYLNLASNNYLGLSFDSSVKLAAQKSIQEWGAGSGASRLISGNLAVHQALEEKIAKFKNEESALIFSSGYLANLGAISALVGSGDLIVADRANHASLIDGARLSGAKLWVYSHRDAEDLDRVLARGAEFKRKLVATDAYFSMDGDVAPLDRLLKVCEKHGAWLMVDEAHSMGVYGKTGAGLAEHFDLQGKIPVVMGTLSKAIGSVGGYVAGSRALREYLINKARTFIYTTGPSPAASAAALAAIDQIQKKPNLRKKLWDNISIARKALKSQGYDLGDSEGPVIPVIIGDTTKAIQMSEMLKKKGIFAPVIRPPTVPKGKDLIRLSICAFHEKSHLEQLINAFRKN